MPIAVALGKDATYVLFDPARLLRLTRKDGKIQAEMALGPAGERWTALDVDPGDGAVWISTDHMSLVRVSPEWKTKAVKIQKVEGHGGFRRLLVAADAIYAAPECAETGVWRISQDGKVLGTAFPAPPRSADEPLRPDELNCSPVRLERDAEGRIVAWDPATETLRRADAQGAWTEVDSGFFRTVEDSLPGAQQTVVKGVAVGEKDEQWYLKSRPRDLFWWKGKPVFLGPITTKSAGGLETLLLVPGPDQVGEVIENCYGSTIRAIASDATRYAAITSNAVVLGDFATAPDLP
jgi:hypothetical protein